MAKGPKVMPNSPVTGGGVAIVFVIVAFLVAGEHGWISPWLGSGFSTAPRWRWG